MLREACLNRREGVIHMRPRLSLREYQALTACRDTNLGGKAFTGYFVTMRCMSARGYANGDSQSGYRLTRAGQQLLTQTPSIAAAQCAAIEAPAPAAIWCNPIAAGVPIE